MKFMSSSTPPAGPTVAEGQLDTHQYRFLAAEDGGRSDLFRTTQPAAGWKVVNGVDAIESATALHWALSAGQVGASALELKLCKRGLLTAG